MKLLLDSCVSPKAAAELRNRGYDVDHVADWTFDPGDVAILDAATLANRVLVTFDNDFGELVFKYGHPHVGVLRLVDFPSFEQGEAILYALEKFGEALLQRAFVVLEPDDSRVRFPSK